MEGGRSIPTRSRDLEGNIDSQVVYTLVVPENLKVNDVTDAFECEEAFLTQILLTSSPVQMIVSGVADGQDYSETIGFDPRSGSYLCTDLNGGRKSITSNSLRLRIDSWAGEIFTREITDKILGHCGLIKKDEAEFFAEIVSKPPAASPRLVQSDGTYIEYQGQRTEIPPGAYFRIVIQGVRDGVYYTTICERMDPGAAFCWPLQNGDKVFFDVRMPISLRVAMGVRQFLSRLEQAFSPPHGETPALPQIARQTLNQ